MQYLSLADATVITFLAPLGTGILGYFFLKEPFTPKQAIAGFASLVGVTLIARPSALFGRVDSDLDQPIEPESVLGSITVGGVGAALPLDLTSTASAPAATILHALVDRATEAVAQVNATIPHDGNKEPEGVTEAQRFLAVA
jgi:drug/metabolite transporter (DMT)-like permease